MVTRENDYAHASPCHSCWGTRFKTPAREITFKGKTMWEILNAPLSASEDTLRALPRMKEVFEIVTLISLVDLPLGMPVTLLSGAQRRLLSIAHALLVSTKIRPSVIVLEEPEVGFSERQRAAVLSAIQLPAYSERCGWVWVCGGC
jgi:excinuclease ABC subunit A